MSDSKARMAREIEEARVERDNARRLLIDLIADLADQADADPSEGFWPSEKVRPPAWYWRAIV